jgi:succinate dehydrogenase hydrophobic anchor subunit
MLHQPPADHRDAARRSLLIISVSKGRPRRAIFRQVFAYIVSQVETPLSAPLHRSTPSWPSWAALLKVALVLHALTGVRIILGETNEAGTALLGRSSRWGWSCAVTGAGVISTCLATSFSRRSRKGWRAP